MDVIDTSSNYRGLLWSDISDQLESMEETVNAFDGRCKKMPKRLREWQAYLDLREMVTALQDILPLISELSKPSVKPRHWLQVIEITGTKFQYDKESFKMEVRPST